MSVFNWKVQDLQSMPWKTQQKSFEIVKSSEGEINFKYTFEEIVPSDNQQMSRSEASGVHTWYLWWLAFVYVWYMLTPLRSPINSL